MVEPTAKQSDVCTDVAPSFKYAKFNELAPIRRSPVLSSVYIVMLPVIGEESEIMISLASLLADPGFDPPPTPKYISDVTHTSPFSGLATIGVDKPERSVNRNEPDSTRGPVNNST